METVRSMYELPYLMHYLSTHKEELGLPALDIKCLEEGFIDSESLLPAFLAVKLLQKLTKNQDITLESFEEELKKILEVKSSPLNPYTKTQPDIKFEQFPLTSKLKIIKWLTDQSSEKKDELDTLFEEFGTEKEVETIINAGQDGENRTYWYFDDLRLYRHKTNQPKTDDWETVVVDLTDWNSLIEKLSKTNNDQERELYSYLKDYIYPIIQGLSQTYTAITVTNDQLRSLAGMSDKQKKDLEEAIKLENPELSKVLSEEPSNTASGGDKKPPAQFPQQNKVFVFSTQMANRAADSVRMGQSKCFLSAHLEDPDTKQFLKHNPNIDTTIPTPVNKVTIPTNCRQQANYQRSASMSVKQEFPTPPYYNPNPHIAHPGGPTGPHPAGMPGPPVMPGQRPDISRNIVPNENLTPEQREHRQNSLASIARIQRMFNMGDSQTDFSHINMAQDRQIDFPSSGPGHEYTPMFGPHGMQNPSQGMIHDQKPPPPYQMVMGSPGSQPSKPGRKRKNSSAQSPAPKSPLSQQMKSPKVAPSPLANPNHRPASIGPSTPQAVGTASGPPALPQKFISPQFASHPAQFQPSDTIESITAPPSHMLQYSQSEEERTITLQRNTSVSLHSEVATADGSSVIDRMSCNVSEMKQTVNFTKESFTQQIPPKTGSPAAFSSIMSETKVASSQPGETSLPKTSVPSSSAPHAPSVNNTFVNAHMSIGQVNIQNVTASQYGNGAPGHMQQNIDINMTNFNQMGPGSQPRMPHPGPQSGSHPSNPAYGAAPNVRIQNKGPNTIQYLPVSQGQTTPALPASHEPIIPPKHPEYMDPRIPAPYYQSEGTPSQSFGFPPQSSHPPAGYPHGYPPGAPYESVSRHPTPPQYMMSSGPSPGLPGYGYRGPTPGHPSEVYDPMSMHPSIPRSTSHMMVPPEHHHPGSPYPPSFSGGPPGDYMMSHPVRGGVPPPHHMTPSYPGGQPW